jgi:hypothetical protein
MTVFGDAPRFLFEEKCKNSSSQAGLDKQQIGGFLVKSCSEQRLQIFAD